MNEQFTPELLTKAHTAKSPEELMTLAQEHGITLTSEEAQAHFSQLHQNGALSDEELDNVAGGGCGDPKPKFKVGDLVREIDASSWNWCPKCNGGNNSLTTFRVVRANLKGGAYDSHGAYIYYDVECALHGEGLHVAVEFQMVPVK